MVSNLHKILVVEDEQNICNFLRTVLETHNYRVLLANSGSNGKTMFLSHNPDLVILDLGLPDMDGTELLKTIRQESEVPVIVLSARSNEKDKVHSLDLGANDYVTKPFGTEELLARVRVAIRSNRFLGGTRPASQNFVLQDLVINYDARIITIEKKEIKLTQTEYNIVELLSIHAGRVLTYAEIIKRVWGYSDSGSIKKLQVNMANIRKKFGEKPGEYKYILNELGVGYRMNAEMEEILP